MLVYDPNGYVGFIVPWSTVQKATWSESLSSLSSASPIPGFPEPDQDGDGLLNASGDWETPYGTGAGYVARVQRGGNVGPAAATFAVKDSAEADTSYRGHAWPTYARRMWPTAVRAGETAGPTDMVTLLSGRVVMVCGVRTGATREIRALLIDDEALVGGTAGDEIVVVTSDTAHAKYEAWDLIDPAGRPSIAYWEEENRVLIAVPYLTGTTDKFGQVALFESTDEGATWAKRTGAALVKPFKDAIHTSYGNYVLRRVGASWVWLGDYVTTGPSYHTEAYAGTSPDHMTLVEDAVLGSQGLQNISAAGDGDGLLVLGVSRSGGAAYDVVCYRLGSAWQPLSETPSASLTDNLSGPIAGYYPVAAFDPDGTIWAVFIDATKTVAMLVYSIDHGESWLPGGYHPYESGDAGGTAKMASTIGLGSQSLACYRGGLLFSMRTDNGGDWGAATSRGFVLALGGWDNQPLAYLPGATRSETRLGYGASYTVSGWAWSTVPESCLSWFPPTVITATDPPATATGAAATYTFTDGAEPYAEFADAGAGSFAGWTSASGVAATYQGTGFVAEVDGYLSVTGTSAGADNRIIDVRLPSVVGGGGGSVKLHVSIRVEAGNIILYDERAGSALVTVAIAGNVRRKYRLVVANTSVSMLYRTPSAQVWTQVTATASTGASADAEHIQVGALTSKGQTLRIYSVQFVGQCGPQGPYDLAHAITAANILGRPASRRPTPINGGLGLSWRRGPLHPGSTWTVPKSAEYPPELVGCRDYPSISDRWRSSADNLAQHWVWEPAGGQLWRPPGAIFGMLIYGDGISTVTLSGRDAGGTLQALITADLSTGLTGLSYTAPSTAAPLSGGSLRPNTTGSTAGRPWRENELAGGWVRVATSGAAYRITGNSEGLWGPSAHLKPTLYMADWDGAEPATGTITIYPPVSLHVAPEQNPGTGYDQLHLSITSTANTVDGRYELKAVIGSVFTPGRKNSHGRVPSLEPVARGVETAGGQVYYDPGQPLRKVGRLTWADPYGTADYYGYTSVIGPNAVKMTSGGTQPMTFVSATHRQFEGVMELLGGPARGLVYLPRVRPQLTAWSTADPDMFLYGRITSTITTPRPYGDEGVREEATISEIVVTGIV